MWPTLSDYHGALHYVCDAKKEHFDSKQAKDSSVLQRLYGQPDPTYVHTAPGAWWAREIHDGVCSDIMEEQGVRMYLGLCHGTLLSWCSTA